MAKRIRLKAKAPDPDTRMEVDPENPQQKVHIRMDVAWLLLSRQMIDEHHFFAIRFFQGVHQSAQISPLVCYLSKKEGSGWSVSGNARADREFPREYQFICIKSLASLLTTMGRRRYRIVEKMFCGAAGCAVRLSQKYQRCLEDNRDEIREAIDTLSWAIGYTSARSHEKHWNKFGSSARISRRKPAGLHPGGMRTEGEGTYAQALREKANVQHGNRAAA